MEPGSLWAAACTACTHADADALRAVLDEFEAVFTRAFHARMGAKLGLASWRPEDEALLDDLLKLMDANQADFTLCWRRLADAVLGRRSAFEDLFIDRPAASAWLDRLLARQAADGRPAQDTAQAMNRVNPLYAAQSSGGAGDPGGAARRRGRDRDAVKHCRLTLGMACRIPGAFVDNI